MPLLSTCQESARKFPNIALKFAAADGGAVTSPIDPHVGERRQLAPRQSAPRAVAILAANHRDGWRHTWESSPAAERPFRSTRFPARSSEEVAGRQRRFPALLRRKHLAVAAEATDGLDIRLVMTSPPPSRTFTSDRQESFAPTSIPSSRRPRRFSAVVPAESDLAALLYTSGTTLIQGVMLTTPISWAKRIPSSASSDRLRGCVAGDSAHVSRLAQMRISSAFIQRGASYTWKRSTPPNCCAPCRNAISRLCVVPQFLPDYEKISRN